MPSSKLRSIPSVDRVLQTLGEHPLPRPVVVATVREVLTAVRRLEVIPEMETITSMVLKMLQGKELSRLQPVINGTGILIHTNLGRVPLGQAVIEAMQQVGSSYSNLELNLGQGTRGARGQYVEECLALLCRAEAATVVNNGAAALILILRHLAARKPEVIISRGELIQIGGGFRIPDILETSGAQLREVGTTNKTNLEDYEKAIGPETGLMLKVHRSNFFMDGFVESPSTKELAALAKRKRVPLVEDLGSGALISTEIYPGLDHEPRPAEILKHGVDLVCFSGDKLLGGPQAGIIVGRKKWVSKLKQEPFFRALRCDKLTLAGLQVVAEAYLGSGLREKSRADRDSASTQALPLIQMLETSREALQERAETMQRALEGQGLAIRIASGHAQMGGGTLPRSSFDSVLLELSTRQMNLRTFSDRLRRGNPPVVGVVSGGWLRIDLRAVFPEQDAALVRALQTASGVGGGASMG